MASRISGITVEIGGDTTRLTDALKDVNRTISGTQVQLRDVEKLLETGPDQHGVACTEAEIAHRCCRSNFG